MKKMKNKIINFVTFFAIVLLLFSCATNAPVVEYEVNGDAKPEDIVALADQVENSKKEEAEKKDESEKKKKKEKKKEKEEKKVEEEKDPEGWVKADGRNIDVSFGIVRIKVKPRYGLFNISVINENDKSIPVLATSNEYISSSFYLKCGKKIYKLNESSSVKASAKVNYDKKCILITYSISNLADVNVTFQAMRSSANSDYDMLKIVSEVVNNGTKKGLFSQKVVLDTILGEIDRHHFYDNENNPVRNELAIRNLTGEKWFVSRNLNASMQILPFGAEATTPSFVALANLGTFESGTWEPDMLTYRAFDTVLSYNNSAACIIWPEVSILSTQKTSSIFYLAFATGDSKPCGAQYVYAQPVKENTSLPTESSLERTVVEPLPQPPVVFNDETKKSEAETEKKTYDFHDESQKNREEDLADASSVKFQNKDAEDEFKAPPVEVEVLKAKEEVPEYEQNIYNPRSDVPFEVETPSKSQLSDEYIQNLLNRIAALEESGEAVNRSELLQLNAELDAILEALRQ
ncbi:MAG: hypothetical protein K5829_07965 [Treponema sp.]|nr:hypothetical protein [Treponema sp.]